MKISNAMKRLFLFLLIVISANFAYSQNNQWKWVKGDSTVDNYGSYGSIGIASGTNIPGARVYSATWTDTLGNFWLFGGEGFAASTYGYLNDLWKYNTTTNEWTWMKGDSLADSHGNYGIQGTSSSFNTPGSRTEFYYWIDTNNNLWLLGGSGYNSNTNSTTLNDLWKYDISLNEWTWINGSNTGPVTASYGIQGVETSSNNPGSRGFGVGWTDTIGNLWLFGGSGYASNDLGQVNDLWKYNITTGKWTWIKGDTITNIAGVYGTKGIAAQSNNPGARWVKSSWIDNSGNFWLFGGGGYASTVSGVLNDLWKYNIATNEWTWISGDNTPNSKGVHGTQGVESPTNKPNARFGEVSWKDKMDNLWIFGGMGYANGSFGYLNDLWKYNLVTNEWVWVKGDSVVEIKAVYGSQGTSSDTIQPGARRYAFGWTDRENNFWLSGGGSTITKTFAFLNDLWKFSPNTLLPVNLLTFNGKLLGEYVRLNWASKNELNFSHYDIERSTNGKEFDKVGEVRGKNTDLYEFDDRISELRCCKIFYRLRMVSKDGNYNYSPIVLLSIPWDEDFTIYPNPATTIIHLRLNKNIQGRVDFEIKDITGKRMLHKIMDANTSEISVEANKLSTGIYLVIMKNANREYVQKLIVTK